MRARLSPLELYGTPPSPSEFSLSPEHTAPLSPSELALLYRGAEPDFEFTLPAPEDCPAIFGR